MMNIEPNYCSFEQCKSLKEKGLNILNYRSGYHGDFGELKEDTYPFLGTYTFLENVLIRNNADWEIQRPEQWQVVEWFFKTYNINIQPYQVCDEDENYPNFFSEINNKGKIIELGFFKNREEATSKAIDYTLKKLI